MDTPAGDLAIDDLRAARDELRAREQALSYRRRLLQAQLDIVGGGGELVRDLADRTAGDANVARALDTAPPDVAVDPLPDLADLDASARQDLAERLAAQESVVSSERHQVQQRHDELQAELVRRYRDDGVDVGRLTDRGA